MAVTYTALSAAFADIKDKSTDEVGRMIGGKVEWNIKNDPAYKDACAIRFSYALNKTGIKIRYQKGATSSGADGQWYLYRVNDVEKLVKERFFFKEILFGVNSSDFNGNKGVIVFRTCEWRGAHIDLFNGIKVECKDYSTRCGKVTLYVLEKD